VSGPSEEETGAGRLAELLAGTERAVERLTDVDTSDDLEDLMHVLVLLQAAASDLLAQAADSDTVLACVHHLQEAQDLLDDGEPAGRVAFEVMAARDLLRARLQH
jgi:hypothetical protein